METNIELTDEEFVPFLQSLGVETYKKSFEWMLGDPDYSGILHWLYNNLDKNNALNSREECRYSELESKQALLSEKEVQANISNILQQYPGLPLPSDDESLEECQMQVKMEKEKLIMLRHQENVLNELIKKNETIKDELNCEITHLQGSTNQAKSEEKLASKECVTLALEVDRITEEVVDIITNTLNMFADTANNKDTSQKFYTFGPYDAYRQSQSLYRSHFDLYCAKKFAKRQNDNAIAENELRSTLIEAKNMEERLFNAVMAYKETSTDLEGERAKLLFASNYESRVFPSQISLACMEARSAVEMLEQEEIILEHQVVNAAKELVARRTGLTTDAAVKAAYDFRQEIYTDLCRVHTLTQSAVSLDTLLYYALRYEHRSLNEATQFAQQLARYLCEENAARRQAIEAMNSITAEQEIAFEKLQNEDPLFDVLRTLLALPAKAEAKDLVKATLDLKNEKKDLKEKILAGFEKKEMALSLMLSDSDSALSRLSVSLSLNLSSRSSTPTSKKSYQPIVQYVYSGCTRQANCWQRAVSALTHSLTHRLQAVDTQTLQAANSCTALASGDKNNLRKLWQWFLTDPAKFMSAIKKAQEKSYS